MGALPWVAPVYRAMPQVAEVIELPFAHGGCEWAARRAHRRAAARPVRHRLRAAQLAQGALLPWLARIPAARRLPGRRRASGLLNRRLPNPQGQPADGGVLFRAGRRGRPAPTSGPRLHIDAARDRRGARRGRRRSPARYWVFAPGAEYGPAKCWPAAHFAALARTLHAATACRWCCSARARRRRCATRSPQPAPRRLPRAGRQDLAARRDGADRRARAAWSATTRA